MIAAPTISVLLVSNRDMGERQGVWQGTLALMVLKTLEAMGPLHGYGIARRIEQTSGDRLSLNYGTLYPALLKLEQEGFVASEWGVSENNRKARFYRLTRAGQKQLARQTGEWEETTNTTQHLSNPASDVSRDRSVPLRAASQGPTAQDVGTTPPPR